jgi:hypothetical protein
MWMEWTIPIQKLEVSKIQVQALQKNMKPLTPLSYADGPIVFQNLNLLLPPLLVSDYDATTGRLLLSLSDSSMTASKLLALQESLLSSVFSNQRTWFSESNRTKDQIHKLFQPFVENTCLHLYCPLQLQEKRHTISIWKDGGWHRLSQPGMIQKGDSIRVALRLQGISYQLDASTGLWTGRFRVQHKISCIYQCVPPKPKVAEEQKR